jgi:hypothetical protein
MLEVQTVIINADSVEPNVRDSIKAIIKNDKLNNLVRETGKPLFSNIERHLEELSFIKLFPYGRNGLHEYRERPFQRVTPSAYARARVMGSDPRFQSIEYLFYIQSIIEQEQLSSTINVCTRMRANNERVNNMHVYTMKLRGSSSYWNSSRSDLIAMINSLPQLPTWFITLSSRDLEWPDMLSSLLHAKYSNVKSTNYLDVDVATLKYEDRMDLLREFPVAAARHFDRRFKAFLRYIYANNRVLGGKVVDHWYRVEFQARGSPHIHMLVWVENAPAFDTAEGEIFIK